MPRHFVILAATVWWLNATEPHLIANLALVT